MNLHEIRTEYSGKPLLESQVPDDPMSLLKSWLEEAEQHKLPQPNAMALATSDAAGQPSVRMVLLKGVADDGGLVFYTNYQSRKAQDLAINRKAALLFYWDAVFRQIRVEGLVNKVSAEESDAYFGQRPRGSNVSAVVSPQSSIIPNREWLRSRSDELAASGAPLVRPDNWGGFSLMPISIEFWQGQENRLHDRLRYTRETEGIWQRVRLAP